MKFILLVEGKTERDAAAAFFKRWLAPHTTYGKQLFAKLDPAIATDKCPYLKAMLGEMLEMARAGGL